MALGQILCTLVQNLRSTKELRIIMQKVGDMDPLDDATMGRSDPWYQRTFADRFLTTHMVRHTQVCEPPAVPHRLQVCLEGNL